MEKAVVIEKRLCTAAINSIFAIKFTRIQVHNQKKRIIGG